MTHVRFCARWIWGIRQLLARMLAWGVLACPIGWGMGFAVSLVVERAPVLVTGRHEADGVVLRGGVLDLVATVKRSRACPATTQRFLWREIAGNPEDTEWHLLPSTTMPTLARDGRITLHIPLPYAIADGAWKYRAVTQEQCSWLPAWGGNEMQQSEDVPVQVVAAGLRIGGQ